MRQLFENIWKNSIFGIFKNVSVTSTEWALMTTIVFRRCYGNSPWIRTNFSVAMTDLVTQDNFVLPYMWRTWSLKIPWRFRHMYGRGSVKVNASKIKLVILIAAQGHYVYAEVWAFLCRLFAFKLSVYQMIDRRILVGQCTC
jgi:hypothetical protein